MQLAWLSAICLVNSRSVVGEKEQPASAKGHRSVFSAALARLAMKISALKLINSQGDVSFRKPIQCEFFAIYNITSQKQNVAHSKVISYSMCNYLEFLIIQTSVDVNIYNICIYSHYRSFGLLYSGTSVHNGHPQ